jgi:ABC-type branched-subunit amino acid transport system substrate-binding protein
LDPKPLVSYGASAHYLSSTEQYGNLLRVIQPDTLQATPISLLLDQHDWRKIGVIYTDNSYGNGIYSSFVSNVEGLEISIENKEKYRAIRAEDEVSEVSSTTEDDIDEALDEIVRQ